MRKWLQEFATSLELCFVVEAFQDYHQLVINTAGVITI
jgi:hypothetical protein